MGIFGAGVPTLREIRSIGQRSVEELVDRYPITCRPVRDLLVDYLKERQPAIDYVTLRGRTYELARCFWLDLEQHHPGISSLRLPRDVASAWKQRLRTRSKKTTTRSGEKVEIEVERLSYLDTLASVRAFYLDLAEWALEDPGRWGPWVAPCPISQQDLSRRKSVRRRRANPGPVRPPARGPEQHLVPRAGHRPAAPAEPGRGPRLLGVGDHRGPPADRRPGRGTPGTQPPQPGPIPAARHRGTGAAAADRPVQDRRRTAPCRQP